MRNSPSETGGSYLRDKVEESIPRKCPNGQTHKQLQYKPVLFLTAVEKDQRCPEHGAQREQCHGHCAVAIF